MVTSDSFLPGLQAMLWSLKRTGTDVPVHVMATPQVSRATRDRIARCGVSVLLVEPIANPNAGVHVEGWVNSGYTKLHVWALTQFSKVVYIDADTLVQANVDELFDRDCDFAAAPDVFPPDKFNAGVLVLRPDRAVFEDMVSKASVLPSHDGGDTGFLNSYFDTWYASPPACRLPFGYNALRTLHWMTAKRAPGYWNAVQPLKIIHYCSTPKPWDSPTSSASAKSKPREQAESGVAAAAGRGDSGADTCTGGAGGVRTGAGGGRSGATAAADVGTGTGAEAHAQHSHGNASRRMGDLEMLWWQAFLQAQMAGYR